MDDLPDPSDHGTLAPFDRSPGPASAKVLERARVRRLGARARITHAPAVPRGWATSASATIATREWLAGALVGALMER
jgi:hypothetical protein